MDINKILHGDCLELMKEIPDKSIDMVMTSPPYDNLRTYNNSLIWNEDIWKSVIKELFRLIKPGGVVVWVVGDATINGSETGTSFKQALYFKEVGFRLHDTMIYKTHKPPLTHNRYEPEFEYMFVFSKGKPLYFKPIMVPTNHQGSIKRFNYGSLTKAKSEKNDAMRFRDEKCIVKSSKIKGNIWHYNVGYGQTTKDPLAFLHPAIFPEQLVNDHLISWSNKGDTILDTFAGSGTTAIAAMKTNRNFIVMEKEKEYFDIIEKRVSEFQKVNKLF